MHALHEPSCWSIMVDSREAVQAAAAASVGAVGLAL